MMKFPSPPKDIATLIPTRQPTWGERNNEAEDLNDKIKCTWLGHACFVVELPSHLASSETGRGVRILFDPVFSDRCSPTQWLGPKRFTRELRPLCTSASLMVGLAPPCKIEDIPEIDAVVISVTPFLVLLLW